MHTDLIANLQTPGQLAANLFDSLFPASGIALALYTLYSIGQAWTGAGRTTAGALRGLSSWAADVRASSAWVGLWKAVRPLILLLVAGLWVAATYVQANLLWTFFVTESGPNNQVDVNGVAPLVIQQDLTPAHLWGHETPMARVLIGYAVLALFIAFLTRWTWWVYTVGFLTGAYLAGLLGLLMVLDGFTGFLGALEHNSSWSTFGFAMALLALCLLYGWLCFVGLHAAKALGELVRPRRAG